MAGHGRMQAALASEARRQRLRQQDHEMEQEKLFTTLMLPDKLKALAETDCKRKPSSPKSPLAFVNRAFNAGAPFALRNIRRASVDVVAPMKAKLYRSPHRRNVSLDSLDSVELLAPHAECADIESCCPVVVKQPAKRVYVSRPLVPRRFSADERPCVTIFSSEAVKAKPKPNLVTPPPRPADAVVKLRERKSRDVVDAPQRVLSFPNLDAYNPFEEDLKYWRDVLHNSPRLKALEKH